MFQFLRKFFKKPEPAKPAAPRFALPANPPAKPINEPARAPAPVAAPTAKTAPVPPPAAKQEWAKNATVRLDPSATPEEICGITPDMTRDEVSAQLAMLYRRHNRAASSLEEGLREEAEIMLDLIATMRQKYLK